MKHVAARHPVDVRPTIGLHMAHLALKGVFAFYPCPISRIAAVIHITMAGPVEMGLRQSYRGAKP